MTSRRLRAPADDGGLLVEPAGSAVAGELAANAQRLSRWDHNFQGRRASWLRSHVRREVVTQARSFLTRHGVDGPAVDLDAVTGPECPLVVTGHQPELFHPGVWIKNFAAGAIAGTQRGIGLNLIVDHDIPKSSSILVPQLDGELVRLVRVEFDRWGGEVPFEDQAVQDEELFSTFADRVRQTAGRALAAPLLDQFWPRVLGRRGEVPTAGLRFALARRELEAARGVSNLEVPLSAVCQTDGFFWFVSHLLAELPRYRQIHNTALDEYRVAHRIRSRNHPVAALGRNDEWLEAPFWVWRAGQPRRRGLLVRQRSRVMDLRIAGEDEVLSELALAPDREACCAVERLRELAARSIRLRTRALTTTMFSRFLLSDLFIHGIGGAKYDELGDEIARRFFGIEPPRFGVVSLTLWLELPRDPGAAAELDRVERRLRDLRFSPDRVLSEPDSEETRNLIRSKRAAVSAPVGSRRERKARCLTIRRINSALRLSLRELETELFELRTRAGGRVISSRAARNRDFSFVLHRGERVDEFVVGAVRAAWPGGAPAASPSTLGPSGPSA
jgi:hypothetical protein